MKGFIILVFISMSVWLVGCMPTSQPTNLTVYIYEGDEGGMKVAPVEIEPPAVVAKSSVEGCNKFLLPDMPAMPALPTITAELARTPEAMEGLLLDHIAEIRKLVFANKRKLVEAYREHERSCKK